MKKPGHALLNSKQNRTAVLYFTRSAGEEANAKMFNSSGNFAQNRAIAQALIDHTYAQVQASGLEARVIASNEQQGETFGEKLSNAFKSLFNEGFENVIAVGNDCIELSSRTIAHASELLHKNSIVAGPSTDGGVYLLGISSSAFQQKAFSELAWETDTLFRDLLYYATENNFEIARLALASDIDDERSLHRAIKQLKYANSYFGLILLLISILSSVDSSFQKCKIFFSHHSRLSFYYRGPPAS